MSGTSERLDQLLSLYGADYEAVVASRVEGRLASCGSLWIFGAGQNGARLLELLRARGLQPDGLIDETPGKRGLSVDGAPIVGPSDAATRQRPLAIVSLFTPAAGYLPVAARLRALGIDTISLFEALWTIGGAALPFYFLDRAQGVVDHADDLAWLASRLPDAESREALWANVEFRLSLRHEVLPPWTTHRAPPPSSWSRIGILDAGAYDGDTLLPLVQAAGERLSVAIGLEPDAGNCERLAASLAAAGAGPRVRTLCAAVGEEAGRRAFLSLGHQGSGFSAEGTPVDVVAIDDLVAREFAAEDQLYIKLDVEGAEAEALRGAGRTISERRPFLSIAAYHRPEDLWRLARLVCEFESGYRFRLACHGADGADLTLYALPPGR